MNCDIIQRRLLGSEDPAHPPTEIQTHLEACVPCRQWQSVLLQVEQHIPMLPVPPSNSRATFLDRLLRAPIVKPGPEPSDYLHIRVRLPEHLRRSRATGWQRVQAQVRAWMPVAGVAAALLLLVLGWWEMLMPRHPAGSFGLSATQSKPDPMLQDLMKHYLGLAGATSSPDRDRALAGMASVLRAQAVALARNDQAQDMRRDLYGLLRQIKGTLPSVDTSVRSMSADPTLTANAERLGQFRQNRELIIALVQMGCDLAKGHDPLERAKHCNRLVNRLVSEIAQAAHAREGGRAREMGQHLRDVLEQGVAFNLKAVRSQQRLGSGFEPDIQRIGQQSLDSTATLLASLNNADLKDALQFVENGRAEIQSVLKG